MNAKQTEKKVNWIVDEILDEDQENDFDATQTCPEGCEISDDTPKETQTFRECKCGVENSSRFSLRVMEAMRSLQRDVDQPSTSTAEEIADYIRSHYRHDGDLYAQVRTALRQVCSQGFVKELLSNEYHLVGPVISSIKRNGCFLDCKYRRLDTARFPRSLRQDPRSPHEETLRTSIIDRFDPDSEPIFHSTEISANERDNADRRDRELNADVSDIRDDHRRRDAMEQPISGPSKRFLGPPSLAPARNAKKVRVEDRKVDEEDDEATPEEDMDCTCDAEVIARDDYSRIRPVGRPRVRIQRNGRRRDRVEEDEEDEDERMEEEDEGERREDDDDEDIEKDSAYEELRAREPRRRTTAREQELKRWIRRCRQECEQRRRR